MSIDDLSVYGDAPLAPLPGGQPGPRQLHRIQEVRSRQGISLRSAARQLSSDVRSVRAQEQPTCDLRLSDLHRWQTVLEVPLEELLVETDAPLSRAIAERARLLRIMKSALSLQESADTDADKRMAENLVQQLIELMPELKEVGAWHSVGTRRSADEMGRIAEQTIDDSSLFGGSYSE